MSNRNLLLPIYRRYFSFNIDGGISSKMIVASQLIDLILTLRPENLAQSVAASAAVDHDTCSVKFWSVNLVRVIIKTDSLFYTLG